MSRSLRVIRCADCEAYRAEAAALRQLLHAEGRISHWRREVAHIGLFVGVAGLLLAIIMAWRPWS
jgi:hypothetical protein